VTRRIDWGDGSPAETRTATGPDHGWPHTYTRGGDFHVSVQLVSGTETGTGVFPDGDTVQVFADAPPDLLAGTYHLVPDHVRAGQAVKLAESDVHGDDAPPVYVMGKFPDGNAVVVTGAAGGGNGGSGGLRAAPAPPDALRRLI
jgi:hypothetical protein